MSDATSIVLTLASRPGQKLADIANQLRAQASDVELVLTQLQSLGSVQRVGESWSLVVPPPEAISRYISLRVEGER